MKHLIFLITLFTSLFVIAGKPISLSGRLQDTSNVPIQSANVIFKFVVSNTIDCVLYEESQTIDMSGSNGYFKTSLFSGTASYSANGTDLFSAKTYLCQNGTSWTAANSDNRKLAVSVKIDSAPFVDFGSDILNSVAYANEAEFLKGKGPTDFLQVNSTSNQTGLDSILNQKQSILDLVAGTNTTYAKQSSVDVALQNKQNVLSYTPINPANNLSELTNPASARTNLGLGSLATKSTVSNSDINSMAWSKLTSVPTTFAPSAHNHPISDITNLTTQLSSKLDKSVMSCSTSQVIQYNSVSDSFSCQSIVVSASSISGLGSLATKSTITDTEVSSISTSRISDLAATLANYLLKADVPDCPANTFLTKSGGVYSCQGIGTVIPSGIVVPFAGTTCPSGYLAADGSAVSRSTYANLFSAIGTAHGSGDGISTFRLPDYRGRFLRGVDGTAGNDPDKTTRSAMNSGGNTGNNVGSVQVDTIQNITGQLNSLAAYSGSSGAFAESGAGGVHNDGGGGPRYSFSFDASRVARTSTETRPKNAYVNYCIKF